MESMCIVLIYRIWIHQNITVTLTNERVDRQQIDINRYAITPNNGIMTFSSDIAIIIMFTFSRVLSCPANT
jgi:hypothetical protein